MDKVLFDDCIDICRLCELFADMLSYNKNIVHKRNTIIREKLLHKIKLRLE